VPAHGSGTREVDPIVSRTNLVQSRAFSEMLERALRLYRKTVMEQAERLCETWAEDGVLEASPVTQYPAEMPEDLPLAAERGPAYGPSKPSEAVKPRKPRK
jgi:hypothetical protein